jgi:signal transduction histidine kinase
MPPRSPAPETSAAELLKTVVEGAPIVLFALDADGVFTLSEGRGLDALGLKAGEIVGQSVFELYKDYPLIIDASRRALKGETVMNVVTVRGLTFETRYSPRLDWGGKVTGVLGVATDVSDAYHAIMARDEFLSVISHELRTPLSSASGWAWMLREKELSPAEAEKAVETVCRNLEDLKRLIQELRDASHAATGRMTLKVKACDLGASIREAARALAAAAKAKDHKLEVTAPPLKGAADPARVRQIAWILLSNAIKYSPKGAAIEARLERRGDDAVLTVSDEGPGLPLSLRGQLFDLMRHPAADLPPRARGLGLGLTIARRLAELHGGGIEFNDVSGRGTVFTVRLPIGPAKPAQKLQP